MIKKLHEFGEHPDENFNTLNDENKDSIKRMIGYDLTPAASDDTLQEIKYFILKKQLEKIFQRKRRRTFQGGYERPMSWFRR